MSARKKIIAVSAVCMALISGVGLAPAGESGISSTSDPAVDLVQTKSGGETRNSFVTGLDSKKRCTIIYASDGEVALGGSNEDSTNPFPIVWFQPAKNGKFRAES